MGTSELQLTLERLKQILLNRLSYEGYTGDIEFSLEETPVTNPFLGVTLFLLDVDKNFKGISRKAVSWDMLYKNSEINSMSLQQILYNDFFNDSMRILKEYGYKFYSKKNGNHGFSSNHNYAVRFDAEVKFEDDKNRTIMKISNKINVIEELLYYE